jgi:large subunit ribosomal protein L18
MDSTQKKNALLQRRQRRVRSKVSGTADCPRLRVSRSLKHIYAQIIDDTKGVVMVAESSPGLKIPGGNIGAAKQVGKALGEKAKAKGIEKVAFDRGGHLYHGRVKALADAAREAGLKF